MKNKSKPFTCNVLEMATHGLSGDFWKALNNNSYMLRQNVLSSKDNHKTSLVLLKSKTRAL